MGDWFIATEGVKVVKDSASLWPQVITAVTSIGAALGGVSLTHHYSRRREVRAAADKAAAERLYIATELVFLLERYASSWTYLRWRSLEELSRDNKTPVLDLSGASGDWRVLPARLIFRIRSLEADQLALISLIKLMESTHKGREDLTINLECFQMGLRAFILAAKLRRVAGLPDSTHLKDKSGTFCRLLEMRRKYWSTEVVQRRSDNEAYESLRAMKLNSKVSTNDGGIN